MRVFVLALPACLLGEAKNALELFNRAKAISDIRTPDTSPFRLKATLQVSGATPVRADYTLIWLSPEHWREEIHTQDRAYVRIGDGSLVWFDGERASLNGTDRQFRSLVIPLVLQVKTGEELGKVKEQKVMACVNNASKLTGDMRTTEQYCFDVNAECFCRRRLKTVKLNIRTSAL